MPNSTGSTQDIGLRLELQAQPRIILLYTMKIAYYMPFKPMGHHNPSGDLIIGTEIYDYLKQQGAEIHLISRFRCRWLYLKPYLWPVMVFELFKVLYLCRKNPPDIWLTYHSYYKAPDILGSLCCMILGIPYTIFQGIYSTKRRRSLKTIAGFYLNRFALQQAAYIFSNKKSDTINLKRIMPVDRVHYIPPGLQPQEFGFNREARQRIRRELQAGKRVIIMSAAMFRPGVKTDGILKVISYCQTLLERGCDILLILAGDGSNRGLIENAAMQALGEKVVFLGKVDRTMLPDYYSAADIFAFPGIDESLGMVYLEAQACSLPVVAFSDWGAKEAVLHDETGFLSPAAAEIQFIDNLQNLIEDDKLRTKMGQAATVYVREKHNVLRNYGQMWQRLRQL